MKARIKTFVDRIFFTPKPLTPQSVQSSFEMDGKPYRLHLRIESDGKGILIVNASTVLHLNPTATEIAFNLIKNVSLEEIISSLVMRYQVSRETASQDISDFKVRLDSLIQTPDLDPETFLDMERVDRHITEREAPLRLDCALTYQHTSGSPELYAPVSQVKVQLDTEGWKSILKKSWEAGIPHVVFTGGEPTLRPDLLELIQFSEELGQVTGLITDGNRLTEKDYLHSMLRAGLDHLMIILQPPESQSWEAIRDAANEDIHVTVHLTLNLLSQEEIKQVFEKLKNIGINYISLSVDSAENRPILDQSRQIAAEMGFSLVYDLPVPYSSFNPINLEMLGQEGYKNGAGISWLYVEPDGDILPAQDINKVLGSFLVDPWVTISGNRKQFIG